MNQAPVELRVGGQTYRVIASAGEAELKHLAGLVDARLRELTGPGRALSPQALLLAAIALAHDLEQERERSRQLEARCRETLSSVLHRIDAALEAADAETRNEPPQPEAGP